MNLMDEDDLPDIPVDSQSVSDEKPESVVNNHKIIAPQGIRGILFIGDPHLSSVRPGRRMDKDFAGTVLDKLDQAFTLSREKHLQPVILGDLFDQGGDNDLKMLTRLLRLLRTHLESDGFMPFCLVGNHDLKDKDLADDTALALMKESGLMRILETKETPEVITLNGIAHLLPVSYGKDRSALSALAIKIQEETDGVLPVIALTHEDFAFQGAYPGASLMEEIAGIDMVVNGHMHKPVPWVEMGQTLWCNPGNITRMSVDCEGYPPSVWSWTPDMGTRRGLERHILEHEKIIFDRTGLRISANENALMETMETAQGDNLLNGASDTLLNEGDSAFAALLKNHGFGQMTEDAAILREELDAVLQEKNTDAVTVAIINTMMEDVENAEKSGDEVK